MRMLNINKRATTLTNDSYVLGVIPARGGSKRLPHKNKKILCGKPLIVYTIEAAKKAKSLNHFLVSTDDDEIAEISRNYGADVPFKRPANISEDCDTALVNSHAVEWFEQEKGQKVDFAVLLQPTSPLRIPDDIDQCVHVAKTMNAETVITVSQAKQHPHWALEINQFTGELTSFMDVDLSGDNLISQKLPLVMYPNGAVYVVRRDLVESNRIFGNHVYGYKMPAERSIDIEEELDFITCEAILSKNHKGIWEKISWWDK